MFLRLVLLWYMLSKQFYYLLVSLSTISLSIPVILRYLTKLSIDLLNLIISLMPSMQLMLSYFCISQSIRALLFILSMGLHRSMAVWDSWVIYGDLLGYTDCWTRWVCSWCSRLRRTVLGDWCVPIWLLVAVYIWMFITEIATQTIQAIPIIKYISQASSNSTARMQTK